MEKKLLIVVDMQNDFLTGKLANPNGKRVLEAVKRKIKNWDGDLLATQDTHQELENSVESQTIPEHCLYGEEGWKIAPEIMEALKEKGKNFLGCILKQTFGSLGLAKEILELQKNWNHSEYEQICLVGVCTDICVVSNALILRAVFPCAKIEVDAEGCSGTSEENHTAALRTMKSCLIDVSNDYTHKELLPLETRG